MTYNVKYQTVTLNREKNVTHSLNEITFLLSEWSSEVLKTLFFFFFFRFLQKSGILLKSSDFSGFDHNSSQNWWSTSQIWHDNLCHRNFIRFPVFIRIFQIFPDLLQLFRFLHWWSNMKGYSFSRYFFSGFSGCFQMFPDVSGFFRILPDFSGISSNLQIHS